MEEFYENGKKECRREFINLSFLQLARVRITVRYQRCRGNVFGDEFDPELWIILPRLERRR